VRGLIEHEDALINQRITWLITTNAFLFTGYFLSQKPGSSQNFTELSGYLIWLIPLIGVVMSYTIKSGIEAAIMQVRAANEWWAWRKAIEPDNYPESLDDSSLLSHKQLKKKA